MITLFFSVTLELDGIIFCLILASVWEAQHSTEGELYSDSGYCLSRCSFGTIHITVAQVPSNCMGIIDSRIAIAACKCDRTSFIDGLICACIYYWCSIIYLNLKVFGIVAIVK